MAAKPLVSTVELPAKLQREVDEKIVNLDTLLENGIISQEIFEAKARQALIDAQVKAASPVTRAEVLAAAPLLSPHLKEENSGALKVSALALLNEYFQHIKEQKPVVSCTTVPPVPHSQTLVTVTITCKVRGKEIKEARSGPNRKVVQAEIALIILKQLLPELEEPEDFFTTIRGLSRHRNAPAGEKKPLARKRAEFQSGTGIIEYKRERPGPRLPVVAGDRGDISRSLQTFCEIRELEVPNLYVHGYNSKRRLEVSMSLTVDDKKYSVDVHGEDLTGARQEACLTLLEKILGIGGRRGVREEVERLLEQDTKRKRQRTEAEEDASLPPPSQAMTLLSFYCQATKQAMPDLDDRRQLSIKLLDGEVHTVTAQHVCKKLARPEACHRLLRAIFPGKEFSEIKAAIDVLLTLKKQSTKEEERRAARAKPPAPRPPIPYRGAFTTGAMPYGYQPVIPRIVPVVPRNRPDAEDEDIQEIEMPPEIDENGNPIKKEPVKGEPVKKEQALETPAESERMPLPPSIPASTTPAPPHPHPPPWSRLPRGPRGPAFGPGPYPPGPPPWQMPYGGYPSYPPYPGKGYPPRGLPIGPTWWG